MVVGHPSAMGSGVLRTTVRLYRYFLLPHYFVILILVVVTINNEGFASFLLLPRPRRRHLIDYDFFASFFHLLLFTYHQVFHPSSSYQAVYLLCVNIL